MRLQTETSDEYMMQMRCLSLRIMFVKQVWWEVSIYLPGLDLSAMFANALSLEEVRKRKFGVVDSYRKAQQFLVCQVKILQ